jgi:hypothetical protein
MEQSKKSLFMMALFVTTIAMDSLRRNSKVIRKSAFSQKNVTQRSVVCQVGRGALSSGLFASCPWSVVTEAKPRAHSEEAWSMEQRAEDRGKI